MTPAQIVVVGSYNRDVSLKVQRLPAPGETCLGLGRLESAGGKGSNQAIQAARCGARTAMLAAIGQDAAGDEALACWAGFGVETGAVARLADVGTGMAVIVVDAAGENAIVVDPAANARLSPAHVDAAAGLIGAARMVVAQLETPVASVMRAFEIARAAGVATLLNAAPAPEAIEPALLALTDILVVNQIEGKALSGHDHPSAIGESLLQRVGKAVVVTLGGQGAMLFEHHRPPHHQGAIAVEVVDTTGAGDAFTGAFAARWARTGDAALSLAWGVAAGALACTARGAALSYADAAAIIALAEA
jgi:ribokinase